MRLKSELEQAGVHDVEVMALLLDPRVRQVLDADLVRHDPGECLRHLGDGYRLGHLVEAPELAAVCRVLAGQLQALDGVPDVDDSASLAAIAVDRQRHPEY